MSNRNLNPSVEKTSKPLLSNKSYDVWKFIAQIVLPALGVLYFTIAQIWGLPKAEEIVGTITAIDLFLGALLGLSTKAYNNSDARYDGQIDVEQKEDNSKMFSLQLNSDPNDLEQKKDVLFKVNPSHETSYPQKGGLS